MAERPRTSPETPLPLAIARAQAQGEVERDVAWIKETLRRIDSRPHLCVQEASLARLETRGRLVSGALVAVALACLGSFGLILSTCQSVGHAQGVAETRIEDHSKRIMTIEQSVAAAEKARQADTVRILEAIRDRRSAP